MMEKKRSWRDYAVGEQMFDTMRNGGAVYVDKTAQVFDLVSTQAKYFFLSRPRRFGKSLLIDTLRCYFEGRKELFQGLAIYQLESEWKAYPVLRINLSEGKYYELDRFHPSINGILSSLETKWNVTSIDDPYSYDTRLKNIIISAYQQTGEQVVVLIDEYDAPMLDSMNRPDLQQQMRDRLRSLFSPLKSQSEYLRFVFLTGITKFSQLSVFSELNNLQEITFDPRFETICGITEEELLTQLHPDIELLTERLNDAYKRWDIHYTYDDVLSQLKQWYDGYHFSRNMTDVYCPWSLINAFAQASIENYWFATGTPSFLIDILRTNKILLPELENLQASLTRFYAPTERITDPIPALFQSGYLTLKDYHPLTRKWTLGFPNEEVREGFARCLYNYYMEEYFGSGDTLGNAYQELRMKDITIEQFIEIIRKWYAGIPYSITDRNQNEQLFQVLLYAALMAFGADVHAELMTSEGRMDIVLKLADAIYIIEMKYGKNADDAIQQVLDKDYAVRFASDARPVYAIGLNISKDRRTLDDWKIVECK